MNKIVFQADKMDLLQIKFSFRQVPELQILQISRKLIFTGQRNMLSELVYDKCLPLANSWTKGVVVVQILLCGLS